jgi:hypothetical protein
MATGKPAQTEPDAARRSMTRHCLREVIRAGRLETAAAGEERREQRLIRRDQSEDEPHCGAVGEAAGGRDLVAKAWC